MIYLTARCARDAENAENAEQSIFMNRRERRRFIKRLALRAKVKPLCALCVSAVNIFL